MFMCSWRLLEGAQGLANAIPDQNLLNNQNFADYLFNLGTSKGMTVFRMFGFGDTQDNQGGALETSPGDFCFDRQCNGTRVVLENFGISKLLMICLLEIKMQVVQNNQTTLAGDRPPLPPSSDSNQWRTRVNGRFSCSTVWAYCSYAWGDQLDLLSQPSLPSRSC